MLRHRFRYSRQIEFIVATLDKSLRCESVNLCLYTYLAYFMFENKVSQRYVDDKCS